MIQVAMTSPSPSSTLSSSSSSSAVPETKVLAVASHVVYGYVGNTMATFVMQALGCEVAALNTVHFSNHTGYRRFTGTKTPASEITSLYDGLKAAYLTDFNVLLSGYIPSAEAVEAVAAIARDLRLKSQTKPGGFFWVLDPVMGDQGRLYVKEDIVGKYKECVQGGEVDLVLPNQFEAELLTGTEQGGLKSMADVVQAVDKLHGMGVKHVIITSVSLPDVEDKLIVVGSTKKQGEEGDKSSSVWKIEVPVLDCFFSGTGDMFAALMVARLREECSKQGLLGRTGWMPDDGVQVEDTPLAKAAEKVLSSMQMVLERTMNARDKEMEAFGQSPGASIGGTEGDQSSNEETRKYLSMTKASEVRVVRNWRALVEPEERYKAAAVKV